MQFTYSFCYSQSNNSSFLRPTTDPSTDIIILDLQSSSPNVQWVLDKELKAGEPRSTSNDIIPKDLEDKIRNLPAQVPDPGQVHLDLARNQVIHGDYYYRDNYTNWRWIYQHEPWVYRLSDLSLPSSLIACSQIYLQLDGLDTVATLYVNDEQLTPTPIPNQFVSHMYNVTDILKRQPSHCSLQISFSNAVQFAKEEANKYPYIVPDGFAPEQHGEPNRNFIRKEQCSFSWDWGPCFAPCGIWKPLRIIGVNHQVLILDYLVDVSYTKDMFLVNVTLNYVSDLTQIHQFLLEIEGQDYRTVINHAANKGKLVMQLCVPRASVKLWYPRGYGHAHLYTLKLHVFAQESSQVATYSRKIGFRIAELVEEPLPNQTGTSFYFRINGIPIFAKGSNMIPCDVFEQRVTTRQLKQLLESCVEANMNMIRVWGGGVYQTDEFYDMCDEMGLLVWQEFMFACAMYPVHKEFLKQVSFEVEHQIGRLMHHPCIVLWSGNNENEEALMNGWYEPTRKNPFLYTVDYHRLFHETILPIVESIDPTRPFISSSPYNGTICKDPYTERWRADDGNIDHFGDVHYYNYKDDGTDIAFFRSPRFVSEYGFQTMPSFSTLSRIMLKGDMHPYSPLLITRNHHKNGQEEMIYQMKMHFKLPFKDPLGPMDKITPSQFEKFCLLTQCVGALVIKAQTEHYRRLRGTPAFCMGALYWQLNDIWQAPTWSGIEYGGKWKMLHYYAKEFFAPILVSSFETSLGYFVHVSNDEMQDKLGVLEISLWSWDTGRKVGIWKTVFQSLALNSQQVAHWSSKKEFLALFGNPKDVFFKLVIQGQEFYQENVFLPFRFTDVTWSRKPKVQYQLIQADYQQQTIFFKMETDWPISLCCLDNDTLPGHFSRNGFVLTPDAPIELFFKSSQCFNATQVASFIDSLIITTDYELNN